MLDGHVPTRMGMLLAPLVWQKSGLGVPAALLSGASQLGQAVLGGPG